MVVVQTIACPGRQKRRHAESAQHHLLFDFFVGNILQMVFSKNISNNSYSRRLHLFEIFAIVHFKCDFQKIFQSKTC